MNEIVSGGSQGRNNQGFDINSMGDEGVYCDANDNYHEETDAFSDDRSKNTGMDYMYIKIHIFICICICLYTYIYMLIYTHIYVCMYLCIHIIYTYAYTYMNFFMYTCVIVNIYYTCIYPN
jgi:hypothetical protein